MYVSELSQLISVPNIKWLPACAGMTDFLSCTERDIISPHIKVTIITNAGAVKLRKETDRRALLGLVFRALRTWMCASTAGMRFSLKTKPSKALLAQDLALAFLSLTAMGVRTPWFKEVISYGWDLIGRIQEEFGFQ